MSGHSDTILQKEREKKKSFKFHGEIELKISSSILSQNSQKIIKKMALKLPPKYSPHGQNNPITRKRLVRYFMSVPELEPLQTSKISERPTSLSKSLVRGRN